MYFEDLYQGYSFETNKRQSQKRYYFIPGKWDYQPFHIDEKANDPLWWPYSK